MFLNVTILSFCSGSLKSDPLSYHVPDFRFDGRMLPWCFVIYVTIYIDYYLYLHVLYSFVEHFGPLY